MLLSWRSQRASGGAEMESAPRRAALRDGLRLATGNRRLRCGCRQLIHETRPKVRASSTLDLVRSAITMNLGSMATEVSREWMSTPAKKRTHGSWKRTRCDGVSHSTISAGALTHQTIPNHRDPRSKNATAARHSRPTPMLLCDVSRRSDGGESRVIQSWLGTTVICFLFQSLTTVFAERLFAVLG